MFGWSSFPMSLADRSFDSDGNCVCSFKAWNTKSSHFVSNRYDTQIPTPQWSGSNAKESAKFQWCCKHISDQGLHFNCPMKTKAVAPHLLAPQTSSHGTVQWARWKGTLCTLVRYSGYAPAVQGVKWYGAVGTLVRYGGTAQTYTVPNKPTKIWKIFTTNFPIFDFDFDPVCRAAAHSGHRTWNAKTLYLPTIHENGQTTSCLLEALDTPAASGCA